MNDKIDFVITWVDGSDEEWIQSKQKVLNEIDPSSSTKIDYRKNRYRDMKTLKYWFRSVEKYAPWVNKIYFVTCGQKPEWLNEKNEKLVLINHSDYMPKEYLPTFNSNAIEACFHKIPGLSEKFVYFNDDMFIINKVKPKDFYINNKPCDSMAFHPIEPNRNDKKFYLKVCNDIEIINDNFSFSEFRKNNLLKCLSPKLGKHLPLTVSMLGLCSFRGFYTFHLPIPYLKSTFEKVWEKEPEALNRTMSFRFRNNEQSVNHWLFQFWQFASGNFVQRSASFGTYVEVTDKLLDKKMLSKKYKLICINDSVEECDFALYEKKLKILFERKLSEKSSFEK